MSASSSRCLWLSSRTRLSFSDASSSFSTIVTNSSALLSNSASTFDTSDNFSNVEFSCEVALGLLFSSSLYAGCSGANAERTDARDDKSVTSFSKLDITDVKREIIEVEELMVEGEMEDGGCRRG